MVDGMYFAIDGGTVYLFPKLPNSDAFLFAITSKNRRTFAPEFEKWYEKEDFYDAGDSTRHCCIY